jgi:hypothetical protein
MVESSTPIVLHMNQLTILHKLLFKINLFITELIIIMVLHLAHHKLRKTGVMHIILPQTFLLKHRLIPDFVMLATQKV